MEKKEFDERLILEVEANQCLYNKSIKSYSDRYKKEEGWQSIAIVLNTDVKVCKERWKNLRDTFAKYYKKEKYIPSGSASTNKKQWPYFEIMKFLIPNVEVPRTLGNMNADDKENENISNDFNGSFENFIEVEELDEQQSTSSKRIKESLPSGPCKKRKESETDKLLAALNNLKEHDSPPLENFFLSLAQRANSWTRKKQSKLEMETLKIFHEIEFEDD